MSRYDIKKRYPIQRGVMTNKELAQKLLDLLGGKDNVLANAAA